MYVAKFISSTEKIQYKKYKYLYKSLALVNLWFASSQKLNKFIRAVYCIFFVVA